jgi:AcrR family transcriptional regulator
MKISKEKQSKIKAKILKVATKLISQNGYKKTSMSKIAKKAEIGEATIYNYFPTKEHIIYEYYFQIQIRTKEILIQTPSFNTFSLKEQLQLLFNTQIELLEDDKSYLKEIYKEVFYMSISPNHPAFERGNIEFLAMIEELISISIEADEIESLSLNSMMKHLFLDYNFAIIYYWLNDESEDYNNTTIMIDKSLDIIYSVLQSGLISKIESLLAFVIKTHILDAINPIHHKSKDFDKKEFGR